jgi:hypothetical protein
VDKTAEGSSMTWRDFFNSYGIVPISPADLYANAPVGEGGLVPTHPNTYPDDGRYAARPAWYAPVDEPDTLDEIVNWQMGKGFWT